MELIYRNWCYGNDDRRINLIKVKEVLYYINLIFLPFAAYQNRSEQKNYGKYLISMYPTVREKKPFFNLRKYNHKQ